ncbi:hypothetical protein LXL04_017337 [Taraxacum kok-saghyz]
MDSQNITMIGDLDSKKEEYTLKVRTIRLWNFTSWEHLQDIHRIEMIFMDEHVNKFECNVEKTT